MRTKTVPHHGRHYEDEYYQAPRTQRRWLAMLIAENLLIGFVAWQFGFINFDTQKLPASVTVSDSFFAEEETAPTADELAQRIIAFKQQHEISIHPKTGKCSGVNEYACPDLLALAGQWRALQ
jgi:hypothetical protein